MDWNSDKSVRLSKFCVYLFMALLVILCAGAPWIFRWLIAVRAMDLKESLPYFLKTWRFCGGCRGTASRRG